MTDHEKKLLCRVPGLAGPAAVALLAFLLYWATLAPTFLWSDSAKLALYVHDRDFFFFDFGGHALHSYVGYLFSLLPVPLAYSQNLMSAVFAALAAGIVFWTIRYYTKDRVAAALGAWALAVSHLFWHYAVINETYSMLAFYSAAVLAIVVRMRTRPAGWLLLLLAFTVGQGFTNHALILQFLPGAAIIFLSRASRERLGIRTAGSALLAFLIGAAPLFIIPMLGGVPIALILRSFFSSAESHCVVFLSRYAGKVFKEVLLYPAYLTYQFPTVGVPLGVAGALFLWRKDRRLFASILVMWLLPLLFASSYFKQLQFPMLIPTFLIFSFTVGCGASSLRARFPRFRTRRAAAILLVLLAAAPPLVYAGTLRAARVAGIELSFIRSLPYRDTLRYFLFPPKQMERGAERYARDAFRQAEPGSVILADFNPGMALLYAQKVLNLRPDLEIAILLDDWYHNTSDLKDKIIAWLDNQVCVRRRIVYLADNWENYYRFSDIKNIYKVTRGSGPLWKVTYEKHDDLK